METPFGQLLNDVALLFERNGYFDAVINLELEYPQGKKMCGTVALNPRERFEDLERRRNGQ